MKLSQYRGKDLKRMLLTMLAVLIVIVGIALAGFKMLLPWLKPKLAGLGDGIGEKVEEIKEKLGIIGEGIPESAYEYKGHYYYIYDDAESWEDARDKCEKRGGHLATLTSAKEDKKVYKYVKEQGHSTVYFGLFMEEESGAESWNWVTGEKMKHVNWTEGEPDTDGGNCYTAAYVKSDDSKWRAIGPSRTKYYICEWDEAEGSEDAEKAESTEKEAKIPEDAMRFGGHSYYCYEKEGISWEQARKKCEKRGGHLVAITSQEEQDAVSGYVQEQIQPDMDAWIGIWRNETETPWAKWVTGEDVEYTNWSAGNPDEYNGQCYGVICGGERAGENFYIEPGQWDDLVNEDGTISKGAYICEWDTE